jgi:hypothetical protein
MNALCVQVENTARVFFRVNVNLVQVERLLHTLVLQSATHVELASIPCFLLTFVQIVQNQHIKMRLGKHFAIAAQMGLITR